MVATENQTTGQTFQAFLNFSPISLPLVLSSLAIKMPFTKKKEKKTHPPSPFLCEHPLVVDLKARVGWKWWTLAELPDWVDSFLTECRSSPLIWASTHKEPTCQKSGKSVVGADGFGHTHTDTQTHTLSWLSWGLVKAGLAAGQLPGKLLNEAVVLLATNRTQPEGTTYRDCVEVW